jgi:hypothetical protein
MEVLRDVAAGRDGNVYKGLCIGERERATLGVKNGGGGKEKETRKKKEVGWLRCIKFASKPTS